MMEFITQLKQSYDRWMRITPQGLLYDRALWWLFVILLMIGLIAVTSASMPYSSRLYNDPFYFAKRDAVYKDCLANCNLDEDEYEFDDLICMDNNSEWHVRAYIRTEAYWVFFYRDCRKEK